MKTTTIAPHYRGYRFPPEIISHAVWLYFRFSLSFRDIEELMAERGIVLTYETIRQWTLKFGQTYANELRRRRGKMGDTWHLDEVSLKINGKTHYVWRAVDQNGSVLDILVQCQRNKQAAKRFFRKLLKGLQYVPRIWRGRTGLKQGWMHEWRPVLFWRRIEVFQKMRAYQVKPHYCYELQGMTEQDMYETDVEGGPRMSCVMCFLKSPEQLRTGYYTQEGRAVMERALAIEAETGHTIQHGLALAEMLA